MSAPARSTSAANREATRRYKEAPQPMGVYRIAAVVGQGPVFIGASVNVDGALNRHRFELGLDKHRHPRLLEAWRRCGAEGLRFETLDLVKWRDEPGFDPKAETEALLALWHDELVAEGTEVELLAR